MANVLVLLSPCITNMPLLTEDLLPAHGVSGVFTDIPSWLASQAAHAAARRRPRRLVLVERHRSEATSAFLRELESRPLRRRDGRAEVVAVYDWRLLEAITEEERRRQRGDDDGGTRQTARTGANGEEVWRSYYFGSVDESRDS
jgi:DNA ligase-4